MSETFRKRGFAIVLLLVLASAAFQVAVPQPDWSQLATIVLGAVILSVSAWAAQIEHGLVLAATLVAIVLAVASIAVVVVVGDVPTATAAIVNGLLVAFAPAMIAGGVLREIRAERAVTMRTLAGVLAIYLLFGMFFSYVDIAVDVLDSGPFFSGDLNPTRSDFLYFSYVTLSTVGYGDLSPVTDVGRMLAVTESLMGQIYLVTVVGLIVANLRQRADGPFSGQRPPHQAR